MRYSRFGSPRTWGGAVPVLAALAAALAKAAGGLLALALVRPWGRVIPRRWRLAGSAGASAVLVAYGGLNVLAGALALSGVIHPVGGADRTALRWHVWVWDLWFLVWGALLGLATASQWRRSAGQPPPDPADPAVNGVRSWSPSPADRTRHRLRRRTCDARS